MFIEDEGATKGPIQIDLLKNSTTFDLKTTVLEKLNIPTQEQFWFYKNSLLDDQKSFIDADVQTDDRLFLFVNIPGRSYR